MEKNTKKSWPDVIMEFVQAAFYVFMMFLLATMPCSAQEVDVGGVHLEECDFLRIREAESDGDYESNITLLPDHEYLVFMYIHNDSDPALGATGIAENIHFTLSAPDTVKGGSSLAELSALVTASNTNPTIIGSTVDLRADQELRIIFSDQDGKDYPVRRFDGDLEFQGFLSGVKSSIDGRATISGIVGNLPPGNDAEDFAVIFFQFRTEAAENQNAVLLWIAVFVIVVVIGVAAVMAFRRPLNR